MQSIHAALRILRDLAREGCPEILIIVPPFAGLDRPNIGVHLLQSVARAKDVNLAVFYANVLLAEEIGEKEYTAICYGPTTNLIGESLFSPSAFGEFQAIYTEDGGSSAHGSFKRVSQKQDAITPQRLSELRGFVFDWVSALTELLASYPFAVIGCTSTFEQTCASIAFLRGVKRCRPDIIAIMGGANCEGRMGDAIAKLCPEVDFIFSGESEATFEQFLDYFKGRASRPERVLYGVPTTNLDAVPTPDYGQFYSQLASSALESHKTSPWLTYETSRGCWWGQKHHCTFCGINGQGMGFRQKSPRRVLAELTLLMESHPSKKVLMVDNIMPHDFFRTLLPLFATALPGLHIFYEQKANLDLDKLITLANAGVAIIQPGIEALSSSLLTLMRKGVKALQNVRLLRYAASVGVVVNWNLLFGFPDDHAQWYRDTLSILPALFHLSPPTGLFRLSIDRFSPYYDRSSDFGLSDIRPIPAYYQVFPPDAEHRELAYHFSASYKSASLISPELIHEMDLCIEKWRQKWEAGTVPKLCVSELDTNTFILLDTRGIPGNPEIEFLTTAEAQLVLGGRVALENSGRDAQWAKDRRYCIDIEGTVAPLAIASPEILKAMEQAAMGNRLGEAEVPQGQRLVNLSH